MSERAGPACAALVVLWIAAPIPFYLEPFWLQTGLFAMAAAIGAIGLTILTGTAGQLSLAHAFFVAVGAYGYCYFAGGEALGVDAPSGLGLPPVLAMVLAVALAGLLRRAVLSPISGRLRGIYLGIASIGLVFIGQHILFNATGLTGGFNGRDAEPFSVAGFSFTHERPGADDRRRPLRGARAALVPRARAVGCRLLLRRATSAAAGPGARSRRCATPRSPPR